MLDPFYPPPTILVRASEPIAEFLSLSTLPLHIHEVILGWFCYHFIYTTVSPLISAWAFPTVYPHLSRRTTISWNIRVTSFIQSNFITAFALWVIWSDDERREMDWVGRIWGYTGATGAVEGFAAGYFLWDLIASVMHLEVLGLGSLAHAISALLVTNLGFRPFANYYGLNFVLYEISTPFLNIHWFFDKLGMTGSRMQLYNGVALLISFFGCRVVWGNYQSIRIYYDVWTALRTPASEILTLKENPTFASQLIPDLGLNAEKVSNKIDLPMWLVFLYLGGNTMLNFLNMYWFAKMLQALGKRFPTSKPIKENEKSPKLGVGQHVD